MEPKLFLIMMLTTILMYNLSRVEEDFNSWIRCYFRQNQFLTVYASANKVAGGI